MSILDQVSRGKVSRAQKVVIYAPEGFGKSTIASKFPSPIFLDVEDSTHQMDVDRLDRGQLPDMKAIAKALAAIKTSGRYKTVIIDTIDWMEQMLVDQMIRDAGNDKIQGIEDWGYGKGYTILKEKANLFLAALDGMIQAGINVVLLAHAKVVKFDAPDGAGAYDRWELKLSKQVAPLIKEWSDLLIFGNWRTQTKEKQGLSDGYKAVGGKERQMHCVRAAAWDAKNRHELADIEKWDIATIEKAFTNARATWNAAAPPAASVSVAEQDDDIPGIPTFVKPRDETQDAKLAEIIGESEELANAWLRKRGIIGSDETYRSGPQSMFDRIINNPSGFLRTIGVAQEGGAK